MSLKQWFKTAKKNIRVLWVERFGDGYINLDGCTFDTNFPQISDSRKAGIFKGAYERPERVLIQEKFPPDVPVVEFGASLGVISSIADRLLNQSSLQVAVEANPELLEILRRNKDINDADFEIINAALAYDQSEVSFPVSDDSLASSLHREADRECVVPTVTYEDIVEEYDLTPNNLIVDIEGSEEELINREMGVIADNTHRLLIELHDHILGKSRVGEIREKILDEGFVLEEKRGICYCYRNRKLEAVEEGLVP